MNQLEYEPPLYSEVALDLDNLSTPDFIRLSAACEPQIYSDGAVINIEQAQPIFTRDEPRITFDYDPVSAQTLDVEGEQPLLQRYVRYTKPEVSSEVELKNRRYCCGCFGSRSSCCKSWLCCAFIFLLAFGVMVFMVVPRIPSFEVGVPYVRNSSEIQYQRTKNGSLSGIGFNIYVNFTVNSTNYYDYYISSLIATGDLLDQNGIKISNAFGNGTLDAINIPSFQSSTFTMPMYVQWQSLGYASLSDPAILALQQSILAVPAQTLNIAYGIEATLPLISWTGYKLRNGGLISFNINQIAKSSRASILKIISAILGVIIG